MISQFELKIITETDPSSILPSRALTDHLLVALPDVNTTHPRQDRLVSARFQSAVYAPHSAALLTMPLSPAREIGPWFREQK